MTPELEAAYEIILDYLTDGSKEIEKKVEILKEEIKRLDYENVTLFNALKEAMIKIDEVERRSYDPNNEQAAETCLLNIKSKMEQLIRDLHHSGEVIGELQQGQCELRNEMSLNLQLRIDVLDENDKIVYSHNVDLWETPTDITLKVLKLKSVREQMTAYIDWMRYQIEENVVRDIITERHITELMELFNNKNLKLTFKMI